MGLSGSAAAPVAAAAASTFDRDAYLASVEPPVFVAGGQRYVGRVLSWEEWLPIEALFERAARGTIDEAGLRAAVRLVCDTMFPAAPGPAWWQRLVGARRARGPSVYAQIRQLPFAGQLEAIRTFAERQAEIQCGPRLTDQPQRPPTPTPIPTPPRMPDGTPSPA